MARRKGLLLRPSARIQDGIMLLRQTLLYLPAQVLGPLVQFVSVLLWTHFLAPDELGVFALISAAQEFAYVGTLFWFTLYTMRYFDKSAEGGDQQTYLNTESGVLLGALAGSLIGILTLPFFIEARWDASLLLASLAYGASRTIATHISDRARTAQDTLTYTVLQVTWPVLGLVLGFGFVTFLGATAANVLWGYAVAQAIALLYAARRLTFGPKPFEISRSIVGIALSYGLPLVIGGLFVWLANNGLRFVIEQKEGATAVGLVTVGWGLGLRAATFAAMLVTAAAFPIAMTRAREDGLAEGQAQLIRNGVLLLMVLAPASAGLWAISEPLIEKLVAEPFRAMTAAVMPWAILAGAARNMRIHFGEQVFLLREETKIPLANDVTDGVLTLLGTYLGLIAFGLQGSVSGAAMGSLAALLATLLCGAYFHRFTFPFKDLLRISVATLTMLLTLKSLPISPTVPALGIAILVGASVYGVAIAALYPNLARAIVQKALSAARA